MTTVTNVAPGRGAFRRVSRAGGTGLLACSALALTLAALPGAAFAQEATASADIAQPVTEADDDAATVEEVVVTAQKREEVLIDIPQSISVVQGSTLERQQATNFQDYLNLIPGLQLNQATRGQGRLVLRGVNTGGVAATVAVYVDETPFGSSSGLVNGSVLAGDFETFDVDRIEVLRGPQGTLYGASSLGGVLKFVTNAPDTDEFEVRVRGGVEAVEGGDMGHSAVGVINAPLSDTLAVRATAYSREQGGFIDSVGTAGSDLDENINGSRSVGGRISVLWRPIDRFSLRGGVMIQNLDVDASSVVETDPETLEIIGGRLMQSQYVPTFSKVDYRVYNATADYDLGFATLTSATSYNLLDQTFRADLTTQFSPLLETFFGPNELLQDQETDQRKFVQELRLSSPSNERFEWLLGLYYTRETGRIVQHLEAVTPGTLNPLPGLPILGDTHLGSVYKEWAGFANGTIHFGERFDLTLGGRYSSNEQSAKQEAVGLFAGGEVSYPFAESSEDVFTYSVAPKVKFGEHASLYGRIAKGFRPGGPNVLPPGAPPSVPLTYGSDSLVSYEVGFKGETPDRRYTLDLAVFHLDWSDIQLFALVNNFGVNVNGAGATSDGAEFTATARPIAGLSLSVNGAYTDARLEGDTDPFVGGFAGDQLPFTPKYSVAVNGDYEWDVGADSTAYVGASLRALSGQTGEYDYAYRVTHGQQRQIDAYKVLDLRAGLLFGRYSVEVYARNVGDAEGLTSTGTPGAYPNGALGAGIIRPRTLGLTLGAEF